MLKKIRGDYVNVQDRSLREMITYLMRSDSYVHTKWRNNVNIRQNDKLRIVIIEMRISRRELAWH